MISLIKKAFIEWRHDKTSLLAASLTFYTIFAIAPVLIIVIAIAGLFFGEQAIQGEIVGQIQNLVGKEVASATEFIIENASISQSSLLFTIISIGIFLFGATRVFTNLKTALNTIWDIEHQPFKKIHKIIKSRFISLLFVLSFGFLLILSLILSGVLATAGVYLANVLPVKIYIFSILNIGVSFLLITFIFAMIYKFIPDVKISWNDVWIGAAVTTFLFMIGNMLIGFYMRNVSIESVYGAAGSFIIILLWLYYNAQIFFLGAEFTKVYAHEYGSFSSKLQKWVSVVKKFFR